MRRALGGVAVLAAIAPSHAPLLAQAPPGLDRAKLISTKILEPRTRTRRREAWR